MKMGSVLAVSGSMMVAAWLLLLAFVIIVEIVAKSFTGIVRDIIGLGVFLALIILSVFAVETFRTKLFPRIISEPSSAKE
ncbi:hypothetical protein IG193_04910 [Infirmifilum lucidum]|uniref:Uncharacterized protein n=1 Tax=Infirmifilum lucidum TaxID=2776706 RepID=A0A7L9FES7_9CREN|nr:hypothetical protein [Infirmifilum lucidum]QOJ78131.1 hypothetical protein IG193_04910 [Infirmifilum lucidum]